MPDRKFLWCLLFVALAATVVMAWWTNPLLLIFAIIVMAAGKHSVLPIRRELLWFVVSGILGASTESVMMFAGPWHYEQTAIINFPVWLPFLWGLAGTTGISLYQSFTSGGGKVRLTNGTKRG